MLQEGVEHDRGVEAVGEDEGAGVGEAGRELADHAGDVEEGREGEVGGALGEGWAVTWRTALYVRAPCGFMAPLGVPLVPEV